jgi:hypothetical protein
MPRTSALLTVSTESVALLLGHDKVPRPLIELTTLAALTVGLVLYLIVMTMLFLRWTFYRWVRTRCSHRRGSPPVRLPSPCSPAPTLLALATALDAWTAAFAGLVVSVVRAVQTRARTA